MWLEKWQSTEELCNVMFEEKLTLRSKKDMNHLVIFNASNINSENLHIDVLLFSTAYKVSAKNVHWRVTQTLTKNWFFASKITWQIWWILMLALASLKISTLMDYICRKYVMFEPKNTEELCREKWLKVSKMKGIRRIFTQIVEINVR